VNAVEEDGWTPMVIAAQQGHAEIISLLLRSHAEPHLENKDGETALWLAARQEKFDLVKMFLQNKANPSQTSSSGRQPLTKQHKMAILMSLILIENGAEIDSITHEARVTPLWLAAQGGYTEIVEYLSEKGASVIIQVQ
jgi:ankyrin repeat protein